MTEKNLWNAFAGESQAHMKYLAFADKAEKDKFVNVARLIRANAFVEQIHASNHLRTLSGIGQTIKNLQAAVEGETFEVEEMYPAYVSVAQEQNEPGAETMTKWALAAEKVHAELYKKAKETVDQGQDMAIESIHVCQVCGFTVDGEAPDVCPVCGSPKEKFKEF